MGMGKTIGNEINEWVGTGIIVVVASIILIKFKDVSGVTAALNTTIDAFTSAFSEPANWVAIVIIAIIGFGILKFYNAKRK